MGTRTRINATKFTAVLYTALLLFTPLIVVPWASELFEFNKMLFVILISSLVFFLLSLKSLRQKKLILGRTPLDLPLLLLLTSRIMATFFSIDRHTSIWGYYSRFHGGLISTFAYIILYFGFTAWYVSRSDKEAAKRLFVPPLLAAVTLVSLYGFLQHPTPLFHRPDGSWRGVDANQWVQDVEERVFSTLGQPNWLAAYLAMTLPLTWFLFLKSGGNGKTAALESARERFLLGIVRKSALGAYSLFLFWVLLFTKSRAGLVGSGVGLAIFLAILAAKRKLIGAKMAAPLALLTGGYFALTLISGQPLLARFGLNLKLTAAPAEQGHKSAASPASAASPPPIPDDTARIRAIVWRGALNIFAHYPLFGSGPGTFAYSYWRFRPAAHNLTSEWEFLYNKAHNEYLNILATTGGVGFAAYALLVIVYVGRTIKYLRAFPEKARPGKPGSPPCDDFLLPAALLSGFTAGLVANFWGFSVVPTALLFYLYPAFSLALTGEIKRAEIPSNLKKFRLPVQIAALALLAFTLLGIGRVFIADLLYAQGNRASQSGGSAAAYRSLKLAVRLRPDEPLYHDALAFTTAQRAALTADPEQAARLANEAIAETQKALEQGLMNVNYWKTAAQVFLELAPFDPQLYDQALLTLKQAQDLAPTDPKLPYNLGLVLLQKAVLDDDDFVAPAPKESAAEKIKVKKSGVTPEEPVQKALDAFEQALKLKPDYRDARYALAVTEHELAVDKEGNVRDRERLNRALEQLDVILQTTRPPDYEAGQKRREWSQR
jgi:O-antigen ligase